MELPHNSPAVADVVALVDLHRPFQDYQVYMTSLIRDKKIYLMGLIASFKYYSLLPCEMVKSVFLEREGATPKNKVTDFLIVHSEFDYSLKDIARFSEVSYACMKHLKKELVKGKWIVLTRKIGRAQMYKLDINNKKVQKFVDFSARAI
jgi:hypothetical protein